MEMIENIMVYQGSKNRLAKFLVPIIQKYISQNNIQMYIEPMVGGANIIDKIKCNNKLGSDINDELISLLKYIQIDTQLSIAPPVCTFEHYSDVRENRKLKTNKYSKEYIALIGFCASYGGRYFDGGYGRNSKGGRSIYNERLENLKKQAQNLLDIEFKNCDYKEYKDYKNNLFYFDPPYKDTKRYLNYSIDYNDFYNFIRELSKNNIVLVSEYDMPDDFTCIWEKETLTNLDSKRGDDKDRKLRVERLFTLN